MDIQEKVQLQRDFFNTHKTYSIEFRRQALIKLKDLLIKYRPQFDEAFKKDYNKCKFDVLTTELLIVLEECKYMIKHLKKLDGNEADYFLNYIEELADVKIMVDQLIYLNDKDVPDDCDLLTAPEIEFKIKRTLQRIEFEEDK